MNRLRPLWHLVTRNPEDGSPLFGSWWVGPVATAATLAHLIWCCLGS